MSRVVVVDDRADDLELYEHILRHGGHDPVTYADPVAALHAIVAEPPDLVVADLLMPELDGFELIHALRSDPATHDQRVVLLSAVYQPHEFAGVGDELSRCTFVAKPATPQELLAGVERALAEDSGGSEPEADFERRHRRALHSKLLTEARRWESAERELTTRARQDAALAELSRRALTGLHGQPLLDAACEAVARQLPADLVEVLKGDGLFGRLLIRAGHGWGSDPTGAVVDVDASAPEAAALGADDPQDVAATVTRGRLSGHGVVAGLQVAIPGVDRPRGILGAYCTVPRVFSSGDREFLRAVATLVGRTQVNADTHTELERREAELRALFDGARDGLVVVDRELRCVRANAAACDILARSERDLIGADAFELAAPESRHALERDWAAVLRDGGGAGRLTSSGATARGGRSSTQRRRRSCPDSTSPRSGT